MRTPEWPNSGFFTILTCGSLPGPQEAGYRLLVAKTAEVSTIRPVIISS